MKALDFSLATTEEIIKELAQRAKQKRKKNMHYYGDQKVFAKHIGIGYRNYQQFEISGKITLEKFIDVLRGLDALEEVQGLLKPSDEDLFNKMSPRKKVKPLKLFKNEIHTKELDKGDDDDMVDIPDVFN
ncbi:MAG: hypothetical protein ACXWB0_00985 [Sulfuricurvum sp.]